MTILVDCDFLTKETIQDIEDRYAARYVFEACIKDAKGKWLNFPAAIFYTEKAHPQGSNYFAMFLQHGQMMIANGITAVINDDDPVNYVGVVADNKEIIYSRYRHDHRTSPDQSVFIDGGRDYLKCGMYTADRFVSMEVNNGRLEIVNV